MANAQASSGSPPHHFYADFWKATLPGPQLELRWDMRYYTHCLNTYAYDTVGSARIVVVDISDIGALDVWELERPPLAQVEQENLMDPQTQAYLQHVKDLRQRIRHWPPKTQTRIFLADTVKDAFFWDLFGLEFQLEPWFPMNAINSTRGVAKRSYPYRKGFSSRVSNLLPRPEPLNLECGRVAMLLPKNSGAYPINIVLMIIPSQEVPSHEEVYDILHLTGVSDASKSVSEAVFSADGYSSPTTHILINVFQYFLDTIEKWSDQEVQAAGQDPIRFLVPLVELQMITTIVKAYEFKNEFIRQRDLAEDDHEPYLNVWRPLRDEIEASSRLERNFQGFRDLVAGQHNQQDSKAELCLKELRNVLEEARQIEQHVRDELQLQVGQLSLTESRKSIEQANISIEEGKRVKLLTILAFFFIPVSLGTSIFGMNIKELNNNGQPIWVFVVTTFLILLAAVIAWGISYCWTLFYAAPQIEKTELNSRFGESHTIRLVIGRLFWMVRNGHTIWMVRSGYWFSLITNGRRGFKMTCLGRGCRAEANTLQHSPSRYYWRHRGGYDPNMGCRGEFSFSPVLKQ